MKRILLFLSLIMLTSTHTMQHDIGPRAEIIKAANEDSPLRQFFGTWIALTRADAVCNLKKKYPNDGRSFEEEYCKSTSQKEPRPSLKSRTEQAHPNTVRLIDTIAREQGINPQTYNIVSEKTFSLPSAMVSKDSITIKHCSDSTFEQFYSPAEREAILRHEFAHATNDRFFTRAQLEKTVDVRAVLNSPTPLKTAKSIFHSLEAARYLDGLTDDAQKEIHQRMNIMKFIIERL